MPITCREMVLTINVIWTLNIVMLVSDSLLFCSSWINNTNPPDSIDIMTKSQWLPLSLAISRIINSSAIPVMWSMPKNEVNVFR